MFTPHPQVAPCLVLQAKSGPENIIPPPPPPLMATDDRVRACYAMTLIGSGYSCRNFKIFLQTASPVTACHTSREHHHLKYVIHT